MTLKCWNKLAEYPGIGVVKFEKRILVRDSVPNFHGEEKKQKFFVIYYRRIFELPGIAWASKSWKNTFNCIHNTS